MNFSYRPCRFEAVAPADFPFQASAAPSASSKGIFALGMRARPPMRWRARDAGLRVVEDAPLFGACDTVTRVPAVVEASAPRPKLFHPGRRLADGVRVIVPDDRPRFLLPRLARASAHLRYLRFALQLVGARHAACSAPFWPSCCVCNAPSVAQPTRSISASRSTASLHGQFEQGTDCSPYETMRA